MRVVTALGLLALAAFATAQQQTATVTNLPGSGDRVTFTQDNVAPTAGSISITDASGWSWVIYGNSAGLVWYNASCQMQGQPSATTWSATNCYSTTSTPFPVTQVIKTGASTFLAIANDTITMYDATTVKSTLTVSGTSFDLAQPIYPQNPYTSAGISPINWQPTLDNGYLYIGSYNTNMTGMSMLRKIDAVAGTVAWAVQTPNFQSNYPVYITNLTNGVEYAIAQSSTTLVTVWSPFATATGAVGNSTLSTQTVEGNTGCAYRAGGTAVCNWVQFQVTAVSGIVYIASTNLYNSFIAVDFTTGLFATYAGSTSSYSLSVSAYSNWVVVSMGQTIYLYNTSMIPVSSFTSTGGSISGSAYQSISAPYTSGSGYSYVQFVYWDLNTNMFWIFHMCGIATATPAMFASSTTYATPYWWYTTSYTTYASVGNLQNAWQDASMPGVFYVTYGATSYGYGSTWAFNSTSNKALWRFSDNFDARGSSIWVPVKDATNGGLWFGVANGALGVYGRRVLYGWNVDTTGMMANFTQGIFANSLTYYDYTSNYAHIKYSNVSGLIAVVSENLGFFLYNATTFALNASIPESSVSSYFQPELSVITAGTWHCASTYSTLYCIDWTTGKVSSFASVGSDFAGNPFVVANRYIVSWDYYTSVGVIDTMAATPTNVVFTTSDDMAGQPSGLIYDDTFIMAVPTIGDSLRVFYGIDAKTHIDVAQTSTGAGTTAYRYFLPYFTTNAVTAGGYLYAAGNVTISSIVGTTSVSSNTAMITRIPTYTATAAAALTATVSQTWVMSGTNAVGNVKNLVSSVNFPNVLWTVGDTLTAWDATTGKTYYSVAPINGTTFLTSTLRSGSYDYWPTVDNTTNAFIVGNVNKSNSAFLGFSVYDSMTGDLLSFIMVPATSQTDYSYQPQSTPWFNGNLIVAGTDHICEFAATTRWNSSWQPWMLDNVNPRSCTTFDGMSPIYGYAMTSNTTYVSGFNSGLLKSYHTEQSYDSIVPFTIGNAPQSGASGSDSSSSDSKTPVIIGVIVAVVVVAIIGFVAFKKVGGGGGSGQSGVAYSEMGSKGV